MSKLTHALALTAGCAIGFLAMAVMFSQTMFRTCRDYRDGDGFECSKCWSRTDYEPKVPFNFCPICGAFVIREEEL